MEKASAPPAPLVNSLDEFRPETPDWIECRVCGDERVSDVLPFPICAKCALDIHDHIERAQGNWVAEVRTLEDLNQRLEAAKAAAECVYYVRRGRLVKIGTTCEFQRRMAELMPDEVLGVEPGGRDLEQMRHQQFASSRQRGEWFHDSLEIRSHIQAVVERHGPPPDVSLYVF